MSLFACTQCQHVENTATSYFWMRKEGEPALCSACDPRMRQTWHGLFPREPADRYTPDAHGFLVRKTEAAA